MKTILLSFFLLPFLANAQTITSIAGNGVETYNGDGGLADTTALSRPLGVATDKKGNIYIADNYNQRIRKINTSGIISTIAGNSSTGFGGDGGPALLATLAFPSAIAVDNTGNIYIADEANERIRKIDTSGIIKTIAGNGILGYSGDGGLALSASMASPTGVAVDRLGNVYFTDEDNNRVRKISASGIITTIAGNGIAGSSGDGGPATLAELNVPLGVAVDTAGNVYFDDWSNGRVRKINTAGIISTFAGSVAGSAGNGGPATAAQLFGPSGLSIDSSGNIYITDGGNHAVRKVNPSGYIYAFAGNGVQGFSGDYGPAIYAELNHPYGTAIDFLGNVLITDYENNRIRKVSPLADTITICSGDSTLLSNHITGGFYASSNNAIVSISGNYARGISAGVIPIYYIVGTDSAVTNVIVNLSPYPGVISGKDTICQGDYVMLSESTTGGIWTIADSTIAILTGPGNLIGISPGIETISYTVRNSGCSSIASLTIDILSTIICEEGIKLVSSGKNDSIEIFPNPVT